MARMFDLRDVFELVIDGFDNRALAQQELIDQRQELVFHIATYTGDQFDALFEQVFGEWTRKVALFAKELAE